MEFWRRTRQALSPAFQSRWEALARHEVAIVGCGALAHAVLALLPGMGFQRFHLIDGDVVEFSNLARQFLFTEEEEGALKARVLAKYLRRRYSGLSVRVTDQYLTPANAEQLLASATLILDCADQIAVTYLINDLAYRWKKPWVYGAVSGQTGYCATFLPDTPNFRDLFPEVPPAGALADCQRLGVLPTVVAWIGMWMAQEAFQIGLGGRPRLAGQLLVCHMDDPVPEVLTITEHPANPLRGSDVDFQRLIWETWLRALPACVPDRGILMPEDFLRSLNAVFPGSDSGSGILVVDLREEEERLVEGELPGSLSLPFSRVVQSGDGQVVREAIQRYLDDHPQVRQGVLVCQEGVRSGRAWWLFTAMFPRIRWYSLVGGWRRLHAYLQFASPVSKEH